MSDLITLAVKNYDNALDNVKDHGVNVTLSGMIIVFAMLILLVFIIWAFGMFMSRVINKEKPNKAPKQPKPKKEAKPKKAAPAVQQSVSETEDEGIIAAISAAVMMMYEGTGVTPKIRSIRPAVKTARSAWATAGVMNNTRSF